jgi:transposase-like protein
MTERATPFYCPYCGDEDLRPEDWETVQAGDTTVADGGGRRAEGWLCSACRRVFSVKFLGLSLPQVTK